MDIDSMMLLFLFIVFTVVIGLILVATRKWLVSRTLGGLLALIWVWLLGWFAIMLTFPQWLDTESETFHFNALAQAIREGQMDIPLSRTLNFPWTAICIIPPYFSPSEEDKEILRRALGAEVYPSSSDGYKEFYFKTPDGVIRWDQRWGVLQNFYQDRFAGRYYKKLFGGETYKVELDLPRWSGLCYKPEEVWIKISPE